MGREIRRVPLDFDWPIGKVWDGFLMPDRLSEKTCEACDGRGYSPYARYLQELWYGNSPFDPVSTGSTPWTAETPAIRARAQRNIESAPEYYGTGEYAVRREAARLAEHYNSWSHHLSQEDVDALIEDGRLKDFTHTFVRGEGWEPIEPAPVVTAAQVNEWSLDSMSHGSSTCWTVVGARCKREGKSDTCDACAGHGSFEAYPGQRAEAEAWKSTEPPTGDAWQLWETTSEGSPRSPVFAVPEQLATWMTENECMFAGSKMPDFDSAMRFVKAGWAPSMVVSSAAGVVDGAVWVAATCTPSRGRDRRRDARHRQQTQRRQRATARHGRDRPWHARRRPAGKRALVAAFPED